MTFGSPTAARRRWGIFILAAFAAAFTALVVLMARFRRADSGVAPARPAPISDSRWEPTSEGDFEEMAADFAGTRLRLHAATRRTRTDTVKFLGVRLRDPVRLTAGARIAVDLDWNGQANGSGLTAGLVLSPVKTSGNPFLLPETLAVEYIGVPPGKNARRVIGRRQGSHHRHLDSEGWPDRNLEGRPIGVLRLEIRMGTDGVFRVFENGVEAYVSEPNTLGFDEAYVYLQMSSRANYPPREVFFDRIEVVNGK
jgi:hypothetical protein